jgi:hypothetical protein
MGTVWNQNPKGNGPVNWAYWACRSHPFEKKKRKKKGSDSSSSANAKQEAGKVLSRAAPGLREIQDSESSFGQNQAKEKQESGRIFSHGQNWD